MCELPARPDARRDLGAGTVKLLRTMLVFIVGTVLGALGQQVAGFTGMAVGSIAGIFVGYWAARRLMP